MVEPRSPKNLAMVILKVPPGRENGACHLSTALKAGGGGGGDLCRISRRGGGGFQCKRVSVKLMNNTKRLAVGRFVWVLSGF